MISSRKVLSAFPLHINTQLQGFREISFYEKPTLSYGVRIFCDKYGRHYILVSVFFRAVVSTQYTFLWNDVLGFQVYASERNIKWKSLLVIL